MAMEQPLPGETKEEHKEHAHVAAKPAKSGRGLRNFVLGSVIGIVALAIAALAVMTAGLYKLGWNGPAASKVAHVIPYPVATVNSNPIKYADYLDDVATLKHFYVKQADQVTAQGGTMPDDQEIRKNVFDRLVRNEVLKEEAAKYNMSVQQADIDAEYAKLIAQAGDEATVEKDVMELYGWTTTQFKEKVLVPYLLEQKLAEALAKDTTLSGAAEAKANDVLAKVNAGGDFATLAKENSSDFQSAQAGGSLGWFERGIMVKEFEDTAFSMKKGEVSGLVKTDFGYHIIKVDDIEKDKKGEVIKVNASHILIPATNVEEYIQKKVDEAKVTKFVEI